MDRDMIGVHTPLGTVISPTLISSERYKWIHMAHSQRARLEAFTHDLLELLARYHPLVTRETLKRAFKWLNGTQLNTVRYGT